MKIYQIIKSCTGEKSKEPIIYLQIAFINKIILNNAIYETKQESNLLIRIRQVHCAVSKTKNYLYSDIKIFKLMLRYLILFSALKVIQFGI